MMRCVNHHRFSVPEDGRCPMCGTPDYYEVQICCICGLEQDVRRINDEGVCRYCQNHELEAIK